jgi:predicted nucleic acid-binding protein
VGFDAMIAATAVVNELPVATSDLAEFADIDDL